MPACRWRLIGYFLLNGRNSFSSSDRCHLQWAQFAKVMLYNARNMSTLFDRKCSEKLFVCSKLSRASLHVDCPYQVCANFSLTPPDWNCSTFSKLGRMPLKSTKSRLRISFRKIRFSTQVFLTSRGLCGCDVMWLAMWHTHTGARTCEHWNCLSSNYFLMLNGISASGTHLDPINWTDGITFLTKHPKLSGCVCIICACACVCMCEWWIAETVSRIGE